MNIPLSRPSLAVFLISVVLAILCLIGVVSPSVPLLSGNTFLLLALAYGVLLFGVLFRGA
jgi:hypothetical protein